MGNSETTRKQDEIRMLSEAEIAAVDGGLVGELIEAAFGGIATALEAAGAFLGRALMANRPHYYGGGHD